MEKRKVIFSFIYKFAERLAVKGIGLVISVILARLLAPDVFGQIAIIMVFINISQVLIQNGFSTALVQNKDVTEVDYYTVFYISTVLAIILFAILWVLAPFIGKYYDSNELVLPLRIYSLSLIFGAFNSVQIARLQKMMRFKLMLVCSLIATVLSGAIGIAMAYLNYGIWALIVYYFSNVIISCVTILILEHWLPKFTFSIERAKVLFSYGWKMLVSGLLCSLYSDIRSLIIGKKFSTDDLGYYNRGQQFPNIISNTIDNSIQAVMFPTMSTAQESQDKLKIYLKHSIGLGSLIILPTMIGLSAIAEPFIRLLLTDKWLPSVDYMRLLCFAEACIPFSSSNLVAIKSSGRSDIYMKLEIVRRVVMLVILAVSVVFFDSVLIIAIGYVISSWVDVIIITFAVKKLLNYGFGEQLKESWKTIFASVIMGIVVYLLSYLALEDIATLFVQIAVGVASYIALSYMLKIESFKYLIETVVQILRSRET